MQNEGRTKKFIRNAAGAATFQITNAICGLITPRIMLAVYGSAVNGLISSISQFLVFLSLVEFGLAQAIQFSLYKPLAANDQKKVSAAISAARIAYNQVGFSFTALTILLAFLYPVFTGTGELSYFTITALVFVLSMNYVLSFFIVAKYQVLFQADQTVFIISLAKTASRIVSTICIVLLAAPNVSILLLRIIASSSIVVEALIIGLYAKKHYKNIDYYAEPDKSALGQRWDALYMQFLGVVTATAPTIILTIVSSLNQVSVYSIYNMVFVALTGILGIFINGISASFGSLLQSNDAVQVKSAYAQFENIYYLLISIIYTTASVLIVPFVYIYTKNITDTNYLLPGLGILFTINALTYNMKTPQSMLLQAAGLFRMTRHQNTIQAAIMLILGPYFGVLWGIYGILLASILSNIYRFVVLIIFIPKHVTHDSALPSIKRSCMMLITGAMLYLLATLVIGNIEIESFEAWFLVAMFVGVAVAACFLIMDVIFERKNFIAILSRLKHC